MKKSTLNNDRPWLAYYKEGVSGNLKYSDSSMVGYLLESVARYPESIAYEYYGGQVTYRDFYEKIRETGMVARFVEFLAWNDQPQLQVLTARTSSFFLYLK